VRFGPVRDGQVIRTDASVAIGEGTYTKGMPLMIGTARDEWGLWTGMDPAMQSLDEPGLEKLARRSFGDRARDGIEVYRDARLRRGDDVSPVALWRAIMTDSMFRIPAIRLAELHSHHTRDTWMYIFDYESPVLDGRLGACHSLDVPFVFGTTGVGELARFCGDTHLVRCLSEIIHDTYVAFGKYGNPANAMFDWPEYDRIYRRTMRLGMKSHMEDAPMEAERAFWESLVSA
jgi:para-nitrobenzyl esterase